MTEEAPRAPFSGDVSQKRARFQKWMDDYEAVLLRAARRVHNGREDQAQDLVQDTLLKAYGAYLKGQFQEGTNVRAWLLHILMNLFITDYNRRQKWEAELDLDTLVADGVAGWEALQANPSDQPEEALIRRTFDEPLEKALAALSPDLRVCVVMIDVEEMSYEETAASLEIPIGTVRSRLFRARQKLHSLLIQSGSKG